MTPLRWLLAIVAVPLALTVEAILDRDQESAAREWVTLRRHRRDADKRGHLARAEGLNWRLPAPPHVAERRQRTAEMRRWLDERDGRDGGCGPGGRIGVGRGGYQPSRSIDPRTVIIPSSPSGVSEPRRPAPNPTRSYTRKDG